MILKKISNHEINEIGFNIQSQFLTFNLINMRIILLILFVLLSFGVNAQDIVKDSTVNEHYSYVSDSLAEYIDIKHIQEEEAKEVKENTVVGPVTKKKESGKGTIILFVIIASVVSQLIF